MEYTGSVGTDTLHQNGFVTGEWTVAPTRNLLARGDEEVRVEPRVMDVLVHLAGRAGEVVSKEELVELAWEGRHVTDDVLTVTIYALRKALGDDARRPRYVETVSRRGYRWIAPVEAAPPEPVPIPTGAPRPAAPQRPIAWRGIAAAAVVLALLAAGAAWMRTPPRPGRHVAPAEAHEAYLKGRYFLDQRSLQSLQKAKEQFERAVALDPQDPAAQAGMADTYSAMADFGVASPAEMRPQAMAKAQRALDLDPQSAEGHAALGRAQFLFDWSFAAAERSLARAVSLNEDYMPAYQTLAWLQSARGRHAEAIAAARRALQLDPVNTARYTELAWVLALAGRYGDALREVERALQLDPRSFKLHLAKGWTYEMAGQPDAAFAAYREALRLNGLPESELRRIEAVYRAEGLPGYYRGWLHRRGGSGGGMPMSETSRAQLYVRAGELDRAIESLEHAYRKRESALAWVNVEPNFQVLRADARFRQIAARVGRD
ncbi:MAG TPA: winged helix-turn-helix domain-containing protein [Thermoanaerobaculia bacterium]|nr:winged helix-turn-helix domain-containing protein [Thermoanaerobaculia bacterium]